MADQGKKLTLREKMALKQKKTSEINEFRLDNSSQAFIPSGMGGGQGFVPQQQGFMYNQMNQFQQGMGQQGMNYGMGFQQMPQMYGQFNQFQQGMGQQGMQGMGQQGMNFGMGFQQMPQMYGQFNQFQQGMGQQGMNYGGYQQEDQGQQAVDGQAQAEEETTGNWEQTLDNHHDYNEGAEEYPKKKKKKKKKKKTQFMYSSGATKTKGKGDDDGKKKKPKDKKPKLKKEEVIDENKIREQNQGRLLDENKEAMNIIIIGHVDSGKSTICGSILIKTGKVDDDELRKFEIEAKEKGRESWVNAYAMDLYGEERDKGKTIEVGKASFDLETKRYIILDCPGHKNYVPNMISGAAQADVAALVVSAKSGEFEAGFERAGQTREHAILASNMGSSSLVVIVNKMDECEWSKERYDYIKKNLTPFLVDTCQYDIDRDVHWVPVDGFHAINLNVPVSKESCPWYEGPTLFKLLDSLPKVERIKRNCVRIPVFDSFKDQGNLAVYGKIESGSIKEGMKLVIMPAKKQFTIVKLFDGEDNEIALATSGDNVKMFVKGVEITDIKRGNVICGRQFFCHVAKVFEAEITAVDPPEKMVISNGFPAVLHLHTIQEEVMITKVKSNKSSKQKGKLICIKRGETGVVVITSENPICVEKFSEFPEIATFALRAESSTIATGKVLRIKPLVKEDTNNHDYYKYLKESEEDKEKKVGKETE